MTARIERRGAALIIWNANAAKRNALTPAYYAALAEGCEAAANDPAIAAVILAGEGGYFCAGGDLNTLIERSKLQYDERLQRIGALNRAVRAIAGCPKPVIAAVEGGAAGAGASIAFAADMVVMAEDAKLTIAYVKAGLVPDGGLTASLGAALPPQVLSRAALLGEPVAAPRLAELGAIAALAAPGAALDGALALAERLAAGPGTAQAEIKALLRRADAEALEQAIAAESRAMARAQGGAEAAEGIGAFLARRKPDFAALRGTAETGAPQDETRDAAAATARPLAQAGRDA